MLCVQNSLKRPFSKSFASVSMVNMTFGVSPRRFESCRQPIFWLEGIFYHTYKAIVKDINIEPRENILNFIALHKVK